MSNIFTSIQLSGAQKCDILNITAMMMWKAEYRAANMGEELHMVPYLLEQIVMIEGKLATKEEIGEMMIDDYLAIQDVVNAILQRVKI